MKKEKLYAKALQHYTRQRFGKLLQILETDAPPLDRLRKLMTAVGNHMCHAESRGCFVVNTLVDSQEHSPQSEMARQALLQLQQAIEDTLKEARKSGDLTNPLRPAELSALLSSTLQGINLMSRTQTDEKVIKGAVKAVLTLLY